MTLRSFLLALLALAAPFAAPGEARAAASHDNCKGFVTALPATITEPGTWCLGQDLALAQDYYTAIEIRSDDVTLDCGGHALSKSGARAEWSPGIAAQSRRRVVVRNCTVRGFNGGITIGYDYSSDFSPWDNLVEDNTVLDSNQTGIVVEGDGSMVRRNRVAGVTEIYGRQPYGISTRGDVDVLDNTVESIVATTVAAYGIRTNSVARGNRVRGVVGAALLGQAAILLDDSGKAVENDLSGSGVADDDNVGIDCMWQFNTNRTQDNVIAGFNVPRRGCPANDTDDVSP